MRSAVVVAALVAVASAANYANLVTFDGAQDTTYKWSVMNDPVMGGLSSSNFSGACACWGRLAGR